MNKDLKIASSITKKFLIAMLVMILSMGIGGVIGVSLALDLVTVEASGTFSFDGLLTFAITSTPNKTVSVSMNSNHTNYSGAIDIPSSVELNDITYSVTSVAANGFSGCSNLTGITLPNGITTIGSQAFYNCSKIASITIPQSVSLLYGDSFQGCTALATLSVTSANTVYTSEANSIYSGTRLIVGGKNTTIKSTATEIGTYAFAGRGITSITIPKSVISIGRYAFLGSSLTSATFANKDGWTAGTTTISEAQLDDISTAARYLTKITSTTNGGYSDLAWSWEEPALDESSYSMLSFTVLDDGTLSVKTKESGGNKLATGAVTIPARVKKSGVARDVTVIADSGFKDCTGITSVSMPDTITTIKANAFTQCTGLTSIHIPKNVTSIDSEAFLKCPFTTMTVASSNTVYKSYTNGNAIYSGTTLAFGCENSVVRNDTTVIGKNSFYGCTGLTSVTLPSTVTTIDAGAFRYSGLTSISISSNVETINEYAFNACNSLQTATIGAKNIKDNAFDACTALSSLTLQSSVEYIGKHTFGGLSSLTSVVIPEGVKTIDDYAFGLSTSLATVTIPSTTAFIGLRAFGDTALTSATFEFEEGWYLQYGGTGTVEDNNFPVKNLGYTSTAATYLKSTYVNYRWTRTPPLDTALSSLFTFSFDATTQTAKLTGSNTSISGDIRIPAQVTREEDGKVYTVTSIGNWAFNQRPNITSMVIPYGVASIGSYAFNVCTGLTEVIIPANVIDIGDHAFSGCTGLYSGNEDGYNGRIEVQDRYGWFLSNGTAVEPVSMDGSSSTSYMFVSKYVTLAFTRTPAISTLSDFTFTSFDNDNLTCAVQKSDTSIEGNSGSVYIPERVKNSEGTVYTVTTLPNDAFKECTKIKLIYIPASITGMASTSFLFCSSLANFDVDSNNPVYESVGWAIYSGTTLVFGCKNTRSIRNNTTIIGENAFRDLGSNFTSITLPSSVQRIEASAFRNTAITSITIPENCVYIGADAFTACNELDNVYFDADQTWITPEKSLDIYKGEAYSTNYASWLVQGLPSAYRLPWHRGENASTYSALEFENLDENAKTVSVKAKAKTISGKIVIPDMVVIDGALYRVVEISANGFDNCTGITEVDMYNTSIKTIGDSAFKNCTALTKMFFSSELTAIPKDMCNGCTNLTQIFIDHTKVTNIWDNAFYNCNKLTDFSSPPTLRAIHSNAFAGCSSLKSLEFGKELGTIWDNAFAGCSKLNSVVLDPEYAWNIHTVTRLGNVVSIASTPIYQVSPYNSYEANARMLTSTYVSYMWRATTSRWNSLTIAPT